MILISKPHISRKERKAVDRVLKSGQIAQGVEVSKFENEFSRTVGGRNCVAVNSGTSGLHISLLAAGVRAGDEVIVPSFSFAATANSIALVGAIPIFVDIDLKTFNIDPQAIAASITNRTVAIQPVHLFGLPANMPEIIKIANKHKLMIFEDAAQAHLASINQTNVGEFGTAATFSFYPTKNMTSGEGGMIVCEEKDIEKKSRLLRNQGMEKKYENEVIGFNARMTDIHATIGREQLKKLNKWTEKRIENANFLNSNIDGVIKPFTPTGFKHVFHQYTIRVERKSRDRFAEELMKLGVGCGVYYPKPIHTLPSFRLNLDLPNTETACSEVLSIPVHPNLKQRELVRIVESVNAIARAGS